MTNHTTPFRTRKQMFPGKAAIAAEFAAAATPEQAALAAATVAAGGDWSTTEDQARWGEWFLSTLDTTVKPTRPVDVIRFSRSNGNVTAL